MKYYDTWYFIVNFQKALEMEAKYCLKLYVFLIFKSQVRQPFWNGVLSTVMSLKSAYLNSVMLQ